MCWLGRNNYYRVQKHDVFSMLPYKNGENSPSSNNQSFNDPEIIRFYCIDWLTEKQTTLAGPPTFFLLKLNMATSYMQHFENWGNPWQSLESLSCLGKDLESLN